MTRANKNGFIIGISIFIFLFSLILYSGINAIKSLAKIRIDIPKPNIITPPPTKTHIETTSNQTF